MILLLLSALGDNVVAGRGGGRGRGTVVVEILSFASSLLLRCRFRNKCMPGLPLIPFLFILCGLVRSLVGL